MRVLFVDEDIGQMSAWRAAVEIVSPNCHVEKAKYADETMDLITGAPDEFDLIIVDLMLAVLDPSHELFSARATRGYLTAGLLLVECLIEEIGYPPDRLIIFTQATTTRIFETARSARTRHTPHFRVWKKSDYLDAFRFGETIAGILDELGPIRTDDPDESGAEQ